MFLGPIIAVCVSWGFNRGNILYELPSQSDNFPYLKCIDYTWENLISTYSLQ